MEDRFEGLQEAAQLLLDTHAKAARGGATESDIIRCALDLMTKAGLVKPEDLAEVHQEQHYVDLSTGVHRFEFKKRIGVGSEPYSDHLEQLDGYMSKAQERGEPDKLGMLTDGKYWVTRFLSEVGKPAKTAPPHAFTLHSALEVGDWVVWMRDRSQLLPASGASPNTGTIGDAFGTSTRAQETLARLRQLHDLNKDHPTVEVKRDLWHELLGAALGEAVEQESDLDGLFVRHTYLVTVVALALQQAFGIDIEAAAASSPERLLDGSEFVYRIGVRGVVESDFFGWPAELEGGSGWIKALASWVSRYEWKDADYDVGRLLYQGVVTAEERKRLGEYYTPDWLAEAVVAETVDDPLNQKVLDPSCGSGTFLRAAVTRHVTTAKEAGWSAGDILSGLRANVIGIDVHPVAVHLAKAAWVWAALDVINKAPNLSGFTVPVYLGDSLQLRTHTDSTGDLFSALDKVIIETDHVRLEFPKNLVTDTDFFDFLMQRVAENIKDGLNPTNRISPERLPTGGDLATLNQTLGKLRELHEQSRNHVWAYFTRNLVRPIWMSTDEGKADRIVGNPPWMVYNQTRSNLREALEKLAKQHYQIWPKPHYVTHADVAGLFFTRCFDMYLAPGGHQAMVLPHSVLSAGQYENWRSGIWGGQPADLSADPWDLEKLEPNNFFPVPASVVFATKLTTANSNEPATARKMSGTCQQWIGSPGKDANRITAPIPGMGDSQSPYMERARQGATIVPRCLFFVTAEPSPTSLIGGTSNVTPVRSNNEKEPWRSLPVNQLKNQPIEDDYIRKVHRGDSLAPFLLLEPALAVLPWPEDGEPQWRKDRTKKGSPMIASRELMEIRMRARWDEIDRVWEENKSEQNKLSLIEEIDYRGKLSAQRDTVPIRLLYASSGRPTAAVFNTQNILIDYTLFWIACSSLDEARYLAAIINSDALCKAVEPLMPMGQYGARHLQRHLWRLPIPAYNPTNELHIKLAAAARKAEQQIAKAWAKESQHRISNNKSTSSQVARNHIRNYLAESQIGTNIEQLVRKLLD
ncbi:N-6 DNA methylase [Candidatus Poriferisocius sp.]|uniref:N-6 DNA methylase n=1 Tax=Candidatus Poriferisocius sp. TaxID=3101276 RepID=UPI003B022D41